MLAARRPREGMQAWLDCIGFACVAAAAIGSVYALVAAVLVARARAARDVARAALPGVTVLKPLRGGEPALYENLRSFCEQAYGGPVQVVFGTEDATDDAAAVVRRIVSEQPGQDRELVLRAAAVGANPKIATLVALEPYIRHPLVVLADSDIGVPPHYLRRVVAALDAPGVGAVTCLYRGEPRAGVWSVLAAMAIDYHFLPSVVVGVAVGLARPCFGSTIALRRETLAAIGGFAAFVDHLADDHAIGEAVRANSMRVAIADVVVTHTCSERTAAELIGHELRWARTIRAVSPLGYAASVVTHPLPFALAGWALLGGVALGAASVAVALASRLVLELRVDHTLGSPSKRWRLGPMRDLVSFAVFAASFFVNTITWRGRRYRVRADATVTAIGESHR